MKTAAKTILLFLTAVVSALSLSIALQSALAAWINPVATPPASNLDAPLNEGLINQAKLGGLSLGGNFSASAIQSVSGGFVFPDGSTQSTAATSSADVWQKNGVDIYYNDGNIGVGTNLPNKQLHIKTVSGNAEIDLQSGTKPYWGIYHDEASESLRFWNTDNILTLAKNGNIGIGTTTPTAKLEVVGGAIKAAGGLIVETRTSDPASPATGQIWLRTDL